MSSNRCSSLISRVNNSAKCNRTPRTARYCFHGGGCTKLWYKDKNSAALSPALPSSPKKPVRRSSTYKNYMCYLQTAGQNHNIMAANSATSQINSSWYYHYTNVMKGWFPAKQPPEYVSCITHLVQCCKNIPQF